MMRAMILAAGKGERMLPLTQNTPKPLLKVHGKPLIEYHLENLVSAGYQDIVINHARLGEKIEAYLGDGERFGASITYSAEGVEPLETGGGIYRALPLLGGEPFLAVNADIWTDYPFAGLINLKPVLAHLVMVENPVHNPGGDFVLDENIICESEGNKYTFAGIGIYNPSLFKTINQEKFPLAPLLRQAITTGKVTGELYTGQWIDIGTPERLREINQLHESK